MNSSLLESSRQKGVVGAGGAGFPTYVKLQKPARQLLINGAECEPLLHKDKELLKKYAPVVLQGMAAVRDAIGADEAVLGIKAKYLEGMPALTSALPKGIRIHPLEDYYPAGDEFCLVYEITGKVIPPGGLPLHVGAVVMNVETILNLMSEGPVVSKYLTVAGHVAHPKTIHVPLGITLREAIALCGGALSEPFGILSGGAMMGRLVQDLDAPITKTTGGLIVLPEGHGLLARYRQDYAQINRIGKSACDQCFHCTELCPRYLLGHPIEPHRSMRSLVFSQNKMLHMLGSQFCCECNLCTLMACPESLDPKNVCVQNKQEMRQEGVSYPEPVPSRGAHSMRDGRKTPVSRLMNRLDLHRFVNKGPLDESPYAPDRVVLPLRQHIGAPAVPMAREGAFVRRGDLIAQVDEKQMGVPIHASIDGTIKKITDQSIEIIRG